MGRAHSESSSASDGLAALGLGPTGMNKEGRI